jgi:hypothetical protein
MTISEFLSELDDRWPEDGPKKMVLKLIGSAALMLQANYVRITKDADVLQVEPLTPELCGRLEKLAGRGSDLARRHNMYLEFVSPGLPFLPRAPKWRDLAGIDHRSSATSSDCRPRTSKSPLGSPRNDQKLGSNLATAHVSSESSPSALRFDRVPR